MKEAKCDITCEHVKEMDRERDHCLMIEETHVDEGDEELHIPDWRTGNVEEDINMGAELSANQRQDVLNVLEKFPSVISDKPGCTQLIEHQIHTNPGIRAIKQAPYRVPRAYQAEVEKELKAMLDANIINPQIVNGLHQWW